MADQNSQDRNLPASQRKLKKAREDGQLARSRDLSHFAAIAAGAWALMLMGPSVTSGLQGLLAEALRFDTHALASTAMGERLASLAVAFVSVVLPLGLLMMAVGIAAAVASGAGYGRSNR